MIKVIAFALALAFVGCTDSTVASLGAYGSAAHIKCWSGTQVIYEGDSTGRISTVSQSDGWEFRDAKTGKFTRVSGPCVIVN
jgi:hypothetical protein